MSRQGKAQPRTLENVRDFWDKEAQEWGDDPRVTIRDHYFRLLEIAAIEELVRNKRKVLDIGCGTGFATIFYSQWVEEIIGVDYAETMVEKARRLLKDPVYFAETMKKYALNGTPTLRANVQFEHGSITELQHGDSSFDAVITERVLINLPTQELQDHAFKEVARVLKPEGIWVLVEVTQQGHQCVDSLRGRFGLSILEKYWHNLYLDETHIADLLPSVGFSLRETWRFETYQFLTKVLHPAIVAPEGPEFLAGFNNAARIASQDYPTYQAVAEFGLESFLTQVFRPLLVQHDPSKLAGFDRFAQEIIATNLNFTGCSHQVLYVLERSSIS